MITKYIIIAFSITIVINCDNNITAQQYKTQYLPSLDTLLSILNESDSLSLEADISEYSYTYRWSWLYLIPSVGYDMINTRPMIVLNTSDIVNHFQNRRLVERKEISLRKRSQLSHQNNTVLLINYYEDLKNYLIQLEMIMESYLKYEKIFDIKQQQYSNNEINSEEFLREDIAFNERKKVVVSQIDKINENFTAIELLLNTRLFIRLTYESYINGNSVKHS
jgi:uncharacterized protein YqfB (UPF0267 family)